MGMADNRLQSQAPLSIKNLGDAGALSTKRKELETLRHRDKIDWTLNREFYKGNQWAFWNKDWPGGGKLMTDPLDEGDQPRYKVRLTADEIKPGVNYYVAQLTKNRPVINAEPETGSWRDLKSAQMAQALYEYWWQPDQLALDEKLQDALFNAAISQGYWHITWDALAGKELSFMIAPSGQPLIGWPDDDLDVYRDELKQQGYDPKQFERSVYVGEISVDSIPGENVLLDSSAKSWEDANYAIVIEHMDADEVKARYPKAPDNLTPDSVPGEEATALQGIMGSQDQRPKTVRRVYKMYVKPNPVVPKGRVVCWIEGPDKILDDSPWPFPFDDLPLVKFPGIKRPGHPLDIPIVTAARPLQKEINRTISQVVEHKNLTLKPQLLAPRGSLDNERLTNEPGRILSYNPINGAVPEWREIPSLPAYVYEHLGDITQRLFRLFNRVPSARDQLPARIDSGSSIDLIQESVSDQLSPVLIRMEAGLAHAGMLMVKLAQKYYTEPRMLKIRGANGAVQIEKFMNADIDGGFSFNAVVGSGLPRTRAGKQARIEFLLQNQLIDQKQAMRYLDVSDMNGLMAQQQSDEEQAYRSIEKLKTGQVLNAQAYQQAMQQVQQVVAQMEAGQPVDPDGDGQPDDPQTVQQWAQQTLEQAAIQPAIYEDYDTHIDVLRRFMTSAEYEQLDPETQQRFMDRFQAMYQAMYNLRLASIMPEAPRTTYQIRSGVSAEASAAILNRQGVQVTPDQVAEPPLDTWVVDDLTKPEVQQSGDPTQADQAAQMQQMQQADDKHQLDVARSAHETALAQHRATQAEIANQQAIEKHALGESRAEQLHVEAMRLAQARASQARRPVKSGN
jgi:hypothetical protein